MRYVLDFFRCKECSFFVKYNFFVTLLIVLCFLTLASGYNLFSFVLTLFGVVSSVGVLYLLLLIVSSFFRFLPKVFMMAMGAVFVLVDVGFVVDFFIYKIYHFHINAMVINILTSPDAMDSIQVGYAPFVALFVFVLALVVFEFYLYKLSFKREKKDSKSLLVAGLFVIVLVEKISYGYLDLVGSDLVSKFKVIPLYQPLTFTKFAKKHFGYVPKKITTNKIDTKSAINYPLKSLKVDKDRLKRLNIFIFASDAVRNKDVTKVIAPNITEFSLESGVYRFNNHRSGGNATRFGIFSMMYGLNSTYWFNFLAHKKGSLLFSVLKDLDYEISIISSTNTNWPEFRKTAYVDIQDSIKDNFKGAPWKKDKQSCDAFLKWVGALDVKKPVFSFVFFDAPHGYSYPPDKNIFKADKELNYLAVSKGSKEVASSYASYKNAIYYDDMLFAKMIKKLKERGLYDNSIVIFTSDHGQEFYEYGFFGHNSSFSKAQTNPVFIVKLPKGMSVELPKDFPDSLTSHVDVVPTLFNLLGIKDDPHTYSNGKNIFDSAFSREYAFCANWNNNAIITNRYTYVFSNLPNKMFKNQTRDTQSYKLLKGIKTPSKLLVEVMNENSRFLK